MLELLLKQFRNESGLSQRDVADMMQTSQAHYHRLETGKSYPNSKQIIKLCEIFKCSPNDIFGFHGEYKIVMNDLDN